MGCTSSAGFLAFLLGVITIPRSPGRTGRPWRRARERCLATGKPCYICGGPIDYSLPYRDPLTRKVNLWSASAHHVQALVHGGDPYDIEPAHLKCNRDIADRPFIPVQQLVTSMEW